MIGGEGSFELTKIIVIHVKFLLKMAGEGNFL